MYLYLWWMGNSLEIITKNKSKKQKKIFSRHTEMFIEKFILSMLLFVSYNPQTVILILRIVDNILKLLVILHRLH
jgi:hypothetical protein